MTYIDKTQHYYYCVKDLLQLIKKNGFIGIYHDCDEDGADRIGDHPVEGVDQQRRDDHAHAAQRVGENVQENLKRKKSKFLLFWKEKLKKS